MAGGDKDRQAEASEGLKFAALLAQLNETRELDFGGVRIKLEGSFEMDAAGLEAIFCTHLDVMLKRRAFLEKKSSTEEAIEAEKAAFAAYNDARSKLELLLPGGSGGGEG